MTTIEVAGLNETIARLHDAPALLASELQPALEAGLLALVGPLASYPPAPQGSRYRRTGTLGRLWASAKPTFGTMSSGFEASMANATPYGVFVQGTPQAKMHAGRWQSADEIIEAHKGEIESQLQAAVDRIGQKLGG